MLNLGSLRGRKRERERERVRVRETECEREVGKKREGGLSERH